MTNGQKLLKKVISQNSLKLNMKHVIILFLQEWEDRVQLETYFQQFCHPFSLRLNFDENVSEFRECFQKMEKSMWRFAEFVAKCAKMFKNP